MAEGVRIELTSSVLETEALAFERPLNIHIRLSELSSVFPLCQERKKLIDRSFGRGDGTRTHTVTGPRDFKSLAATYYATPPCTWRFGTRRHPWIVYYHFANSYLRQSITVVLNLY